MTKSILITGSTDGIGLETAKHLAKGGHKILIHGRSEQKLASAAKAIGDVESYCADLSSIAGARALAAAVQARHSTLDVLINNAGVYKVANPTSEAGFDLRFMVNTIAPYALTKALLPNMGKGARIVNLSSAAQAPFDLAAVAGKAQLGTHEAYAQSKLAITAWTMELAAEHPDGPAFFAINPGSLLATTMVKEGFGVAGNDIRIGVDILSRAALSAEFDGKSGAYFDNDAGTFSRPHPFALTQSNRRGLMRQLEDILEGA